MGKKLELIKPLLAWLSLVAMELTSILTICLDRINLFIVNKLFLYDVVIPVGLKKDISFLITTITGILVAIYTYHKTMNLLKDKEKKKDGQENK